MSIVFFVCIFSLLTFMVVHNIKKIVEAVRERKKNSKKGDTDKT